MKKNKNFVWITAILSLFLVTASWKQAPQLLLSQPTSMELSTQGLQISARVYTPQNSHEFLHQDLQSQGYVPVEVTIYNNTGKSYAISAASVPLSCATPNEVAWSVTKGSLPRSIGYKIASFFFWPIMIPSTIDGIYTYKNHRALVKDLTAKTLKMEDEVLPPYAAVKRILYVKQESMREAFSFSLQEVGSKDLQVIHLNVIS